jgi:predicted nucleic acid-binding protein
MVIDASVGVKWVVPEDDSAAAIELLQNGNVFVPTLFHVEVGNAIWKKVRRNEIALEPVLPFYGALPELVQTISEVPFNLRAAELAVELQHPIYDCFYLAMAENMDEELVTADLRFLAVVGGSSHSRRVRSL